MMTEQETSDPVEVLAGQFADEYCNDQNPSIEDYVDRFPQFADEIRQLFPTLIVEELAARFLQQQRLKQRPTVDQYAQQHPEYASQIRALLPALVKMHGRQSWQSTVTMHPTNMVWQPPPTRLGDYAIKCELGRGGMAVVYEAVQTTLGRRVALKVLPLGSSDEDERRLRFRREAEAAAKLDHPNIVPVYEVGEYEGQPYFSMKYVDGMPLSQRLVDGPLDPKDAVALLIPICRAIEEAHRSGVLHRDLKPANILLDRNNHPLVADFGLAKQFDIGSDISHTNAAVGTPSYMAPEQAMGRMEEIGVATDVYGLGAVLYATLLARPPFQAATVVDTLRLVTTRNPVAPRQMNPVIDRDLETICLKCLRKEHSSRYDSAGAIADDLERYANGLPILARPIGHIGRTVRWCKRYPMAAVALLLLAVTCAVSITATAITSSALSDSEQSRKDSEQSRQHSQDTVEFFLTKISEEDLLEQPGMQPLRRELLEQALSYYRAVLARRDKDPEVLQRQADALYRVGLIEEKIDDLDAALGSFRRSERRFADLLRSQPESSELQMGRSKAITAIGNVHYVRGELSEAASYYRDAIAIRSKVASTQPNNIEHGRLLANAHMHLGLVEQACSDYDKASLEFERAEFIRRELLREQPDDPNLQRDLASGLFNQATLEASEVDLPRAGSVSQERFTIVEKQLQEARELFERLADDAPLAPARQYRLAMCYRMLADWYAHHDAAVAADWYERVLGRLESLAANNPRVLDYHEALAGIYMNRGRWQFQRGQSAPAIDSFRSACRTFDVLTREQPNAIRYRRDSAIALRALGELYASAGQFDSAGQLLKQAGESFRDLLHSHPGDAEFQAQFEACTVALEQVEEMQHGETEE